MNLRFSGEKQKQNNKTSTPSTRQFVHVFKDFYQHKRVVIYIFVYFLLKRIRLENEQIVCLILV